MKKDVLFSLLVLGVVCVSGHYRTQRSRLTNVPRFVPSQAFLNTEPSRSNYYDAEMSAFRRLQLRNILQSLTTDASDDVSQAPINEQSFEFLGQADVKRSLLCNTRRITMEMIREFLRSGRICGFRVATFRFGLGGRK